MNNKTSSDNHEKINLKALSIIFLTSLIILGGLYFIFKDKENGLQLIKEEETSPSEEGIISDTNKIITDCNKIQGKIINDFENDKEIEIISQGNTVSQKIKKNGLCNDYLSINYLFDSESEYGYEIALIFDNTNNWKDYNTFNFLIKCENSLGDKNCLKIYEEDGDSWNYCGKRFDCTDNPWSSISIDLRFDELVEDSTGDGKRDWDKIKNYQLVFSDEIKKNTVSLDNIYLT